MKVKESMLMMGFAVPMVPMVAVIYNDPTRRLGPAADVLAVAIPVARR
jgi:hypothetical protein